MEIRRLTPDGIAQFLAYLANLRREPALAPPTHLLTEKGMSETTGSESEIDSDRRFTNRMEAATYIDEVLARARLLEIERDVGIWTWLSLLYFDQICPTDKLGRRKVGEEARYFPQIEVSRRYYRHMLLGPVMMYRAHKETPNRLLALLSDPLHVATSETYRLFIENSSFIACDGVVEMATWLYYDFGRGKLKRGVGSKKDGGCRRLIDFLQQLDCTFDLPLLTFERLKSMLPKEFRRFVPHQLQLIR